MPVMIIIRASKVTPQIFEAVRERVGWVETPPAGAISHAIAFTEAGAVEVNVWESQALFDAYVETRLRPVMEALGVVLDDVQVLDTHSVAIGEPAYDYMLPTPMEPAKAPEGRVMALYRRRNIPADLYESFRARAPIDTVPGGALSHANGRTGDGILSVDVWEDGRAMMDYIRGVLIPAVEAEGIEFRWPEIVPLGTFVTTPASKAYERPFARTSALAPAE